MRLFDWLRNTDSGTPMQSPVSNPQARFAFEARNVFTGETSEPVLNQFSLKVAPGETVVIATKDSNQLQALLDLISGTISPTRGKLLAFARPFQQSDISMCEFSALPSCKHLRELFDAKKQTYTENQMLRSSGFLEAIRSRRISAEVESIAQFDPPLSRVELRRLHLFNSLSSDAEILVLVKPFVGLDNSQRSQLKQSIGSATASKATIIVSNEVSLARQSDRVLMLDHGKLCTIDGFVTSDTLDKVCSKPMGDIETQIEELKERIQSSTTDSTASRTFIERDTLEETRHVTTKLVWDTTLDRPLLLKCPRTDLGVSLVNKERLRLAEIEGNNVVRIVETNDEQNLALTFPGARSLQDLLDDKHEFGLADIYALGFDIAQGLKCFHSQGFAHGAISARTVSQHNGIWTINSSPEPTSNEREWHHDVQDLADLLGLALGRFLQQNNYRKESLAALSLVLRSMRFENQNDIPTANALTNIFRRLLTSTPHLEELAAAAVTDSELARQ